MLLLLLLLVFFGLALLLFFDLLEDVLLDLVSFFVLLTLRDAFVAGFFLADAIFLFFFDLDFSFHFDFLFRVSVDYY